jgi:xanthine/CO dehydrogenase XdhC/CoxF family maturation factor
LAELKSRESMKEVSEIVRAFGELCAAGKSAALATVVAVEGSSYRRPGARMLIAEDGRTWGNVSGGCLDRDVILRARGIIASQIPIVCRYETTDDEELSRGASTGCGGAVEIFIQPISGEFPGPVFFMADVLKRREAAIIATVLKATGIEGVFAGACGPMHRVERVLIDPSLILAVADAPADLAAAGKANVLRYRAGDISADVFVEQISAPQSLVIFGAGPDAMPVAQMAKSLGWHVTVVGARPATAMHERFAFADVLRVTSSDDSVEGVEILPESAVVVMTHNFARDCDILARLPRPVRYLGVLGPRQRTEHLLRTIAGTNESGARRSMETSVAGGARIAPPVKMCDLFAPVGLDLGAESPEEIGLSIIAEIQAVIRQTSAESLRAKAGPIHEPAARTAEIHPAEISSSQELGKSEEAAAAAWGGSCPV